MKKSSFLIAVVVDVAAIVLASLWGALWLSKQSLTVLLAIDSNRVSKSVIALTAIGLLTMALIQAARNLLLIRARYHKERVRSWLDQDDDTVETLHQRLQIGDDPLAFYDLPIQSVCGQIAAVAEAVLVEEVGSSDGGTSDKVKVSSLLRRLAGSGAKADLDKLDEGQKPKGAADAVEAMEEAKRVREFQNLRARLGSHIQRNIDNFQITAGTRWRWGLRVTAFLVSFVLSGSVLIGSAMHWTQFLALLGAALIGGLIGGYLASVFRDLVAVIERLRHP